MKAVRKLRWKITGVLAIAVFFMLLWQCANPVNQPPLRWATSIDVPMTNDSFFVAEKMKDLFKQINAEKIDILFGGRSPDHTGFIYDTTNPDSLLRESVRGDTAVFSILRNDTVTYEVHEDSMKSQDFHPRLGPITISNAPVSRQTAAVPAGSFNFSTNAVLSKISTIIFNAASPALSVSVTNTSAATISNLKITIFGSTDTIAILAGNGTANITFPAGGKGVSNGVLPVGLQGSSSVAGSIQFGFDCNSMIFDYAQLQDSLVSFQQQVTNDYELTDTLNVDYIDVKEGQFQYIFYNYLHIPLELNVTQLHLWQSSFCAIDSLTSIATLSQATLTAFDTNNYYFGQLTNGYQRVEVGSSLTPQYQRSNLAGTRLFPLWNPNLGQTGKSVSRVLYTIKNIVPTGQMLTISAGDSMLFTIRSPSFKFQEMAGTVTQAYVRTGDTAKVAVPFPWNAKSKDSLRNHFILNSVKADVFLTPTLPDSSLITPRRAIIDTIGVVYTAFNPANPQVQSTGNDTIHNAINKKLFRLKPLDIKNILNQWPDSMYVAVGVQVPIGTHLRALNDLGTSDPLYNKYMGRMNIKANIQARMNAVLSWTVDSSTSLDLGTGKFKVPKASRYINKMDSLKAALSMRVHNRSNINLTLYALAASSDTANQNRHSILALDSLPLDSVWYYISNPALAQQRGFVNLLGAQGISIPPRESTLVEADTLSEWQLKTLLSTDSAGWRWEARFRPQAADSLNDTDFIFIHSKLSITGNNNMDSLLIWK